MFGTVSADLEAGARNAVEVCLAIQPDERVALIADEASGDVAATIAAALDEVGAPWNGVLIERVSERPMTAAPAQVLAALEHADAGILCVQPQQGDSDCRVREIDGTGAKSRNELRWKCVDVHFQADGQCCRRGNGGNDVVHLQHIGPELLVAECVVAEDILPVEVGWFPAC